MTMHTEQRPVAFMQTFGGQMVLTAVAIAAIVAIAWFYVF